MKVFLPFFALSLIAIVITYFMSSDEEIETDMARDLEVSASIHTALDKVQNKKPINRIRPPVKIEERKMSPGQAIDVAKNTNDKIREVQMQHFDEVYEQVTSGWDRNMADLFLQKLKLTQEDLTYYYELKNQFESQKMETFKDFHEAKFEQFGQDYKYDQQDDELQIAIDELKGDFTERLREKIGEDNYRAYSDSLANYNKKIVDKSEGRTGPKILVEF